MVRIFGTTPSGPLLSEHQQAQDGPAREVAGAAKRGPRATQVDVDALEARVAELEGELRRLELSSTSIGACYSQMNPIGNEPLRDCNLPIPQGDFVKKTHVIQLRDPVEQLNTRFYSQ